MPYKDLAPCPPPSSDAVRRSMRGNRSINTKPELTVRRLLREAGFGGYRLHWRSAPGQPDVAYPGRKVAVFVNGCYWHRCPICEPPAPRTHSEYWTPKFGKTVERDERKIAELEAAGWQVFTIWECELKRRPLEAVSDVVDALREADTRSHESKR